MFRFVYRLGADHSSRFGNAMRALQRPIGAGASSERSAGPNRVRSLSPLDSLTRRDGYRREEER